MSITASEARRTLFPLIEQVNELAELEKEESWLLVSSLSNMEAYFAQQEKALHEVRASLEHQVSEAQLESAA